MTTFNFYFLLLHLYPLPSPLHFGEYIPLQIVLVISLYSILPTLIPKKTTFHSNPSYDQLPTYNGDHLLLPNYGDYTPLYMLHLLSAISTLFLTH